MSQTTHDADPGGKAARFLERVNENIGIVHRVCRVWVPRDEAEREELFQEVLFQLWRAYPRYEGRSRFSTWMYQVALNTAITRTRRDLRTPPREELADRPATSPGADEELHRRRERALLHDAIGELPPVDRAVVLLHLDGRGYDEIASLTGLSRTNVSVRLVRIRRALKEAIGSNP